jgi:hypothetical protein
MSNRRSIGRPRLSFVIERRACVWSGRFFFHSFHICRILSNSIRVIMPPTVHHLYGRDVGKHSHRDKKEAFWWEMERWFGHSSCVFFYCSARPREGAPSPNRGRLGRSTNQPGQLLVRTVCIFVLHTVQPGGRGYKLAVHAAT